jgi:predicted peptidase
MKPITVALASLPFLAMSAVAADPNLFADVSLLDGANLQLPARLWIPRDAANQPMANRPLIVFLHGAGESGSNNTAQVNGNIDLLLGKCQSRNIYLLAPQWGAHNGWDDATFAARVQTLVEQLTPVYDFNVTRIYVTGLSAGGGRTEQILVRNPATYAAALPICAVGHWGDYTRTIGKSTWFFHARDDSTVSVPNSRNIFNLMLAAHALPTVITWPAPGQPNQTYDFVAPLSIPGTPPRNSAPTSLKYTEFQSGGHAIWNRVYGSDASINWLLAQVNCNAACPADVDDGAGTGVCDGGVGIEDLLFYLDRFSAGDLRADIDDGTATGTRDGGVGIEDLLYYLSRYDAGC